MDKTLGQLRAVHNARFVKEIEEWLTLYQSACLDIGGRRWRQKNRDELLTKVEKHLWQVVRGKGVHHATFRRRCQMAREALAR